MQASVRVSQNQKNVYKRTPNLSHKVILGSCISVAIKHPKRYVFKITYEKMEWKIKFPSSTKT